MNKLKKIQINKAKLLMMNKKVNKKTIINNNKFKKNYVKINKVSKII